MKLNELFDTVERERPTKGIQRYTQTDRPDDNYGYYSMVRPDKTDPHMVRKTPFRPFKGQTNDAYFTYIKYIVDNKIAQENPYAPRVYKIDKFTDPENGAMKFNIKMEQLVKLSKLEPEQLVTIYEKITGREVQEDYVNSYVIADFVDGILTGHHLSTDEQLNDLMKTIWKIKKQYRFSNDLHHGNMMARITPYGPQLVITDPLS